MKVFRGLLILAVLSLVFYYGFFTNNEIYADWVIDMTPPTVSPPAVENSPGVIKSCFTNTAPSDFPLTVTSQITDPPITSGIVPLCGVKLNGTDVASTPAYTPVSNDPPTNPALPSIGTCTASIQSIIDNLQIDADNVVRVTATDWAGNSGFAESSFNYSTNCTPGPWIKTTGGDVHTNESINIP